MRDPVRLREEGGSALEHALLDVGKSYRGGASTRAKTLGALGLAGSATLVAATARGAPALARLGWKMAGVKLLAAATVVTAAVAVPVGYYAWHRQPVAARASVPAVALAAPAPAMAPAPAAPVATAPAVEVPAPPAPHPAWTGRTLASHSPAASPSATLASELSSIDAVRSSLARGDAEDALARLEVYARRYPRGRLAIEAEVLRIDALGESGRAEAAHARAEAFLRAHPRSVLAARVRGRLGD